MRGMADIVDQDGKVVGGVDKQGRLYGMNNLGDFVPFGTIGGNIWEFFNPGRVQDEFRAMGKEAPPVSEIMYGSALDTVERAEEHISQGIDNAALIGRWVVIGLVSLAIVQLFQHLPKVK